MYQYKNNDTKLNFWKHQNNIKKQAEDNRGSKIDPKRILSKKDKATVWNNSQKHYEFDYNIFRVDIIGNVGIKGICYNTNSYNKCFAIEYEHLLSHSKNGRTNISNTVILNAGINRSKGHREIFLHNYEEYRGLKAIHGVSAESLLKDLEHFLHETCERYNLYFIKANNYWTLGKTENGTYSEYNNEYEYDCETYVDDDCEIENDNESDNNLFNKNAEVIAITCIAVAINEAVTYSYKGYIKPLVTDNKETTTIDKVITYTTTAILTGLTCYIGAAFLSSGKKEEKDN